MQNIDNVTIWGVLCLAVVVLGSKQAKRIYTLELTTQLNTDMAIFCQWLVYKICVKAAIYQCHLNHKSLVDRFYDKVRGATIVVAPRGL